MNTETDLFKIETNHVLPMRGSLLISEPFLQGYDFGRSVILLVEHSQEGSMGLVLNKSIPLCLGDIFPDISNEVGVPIYRGGPVGSADTLFFLHTLSEIPGAKQVADGLWLNGDFDAMKDYIKLGRSIEGRVRFFLGYAGWEGGQLDSEITSNTWLISQAPLHEIMDLDGMDDLWKHTMGQLGGKYAIWARFPRNPLLN